MRLSRRVAGGLLVLYLLAGAFAVFWPSGVYTTASIHEMQSLVHDLGAPAWVSGGEIEAGLNVLLFVPLTFLGRALLPRVGWFVWVLAGFVAACGIEATQMLFLSGRQPSAVDVVANTLGALVGAVLAVLLLRPRNRPKQQAREPVPDGRPQ